MATSPKKATAPISLSHRTTIPLNGEHLTTTEFMDFNVAKKMELVPGQSIDVQHAIMTRLEPMVVPTFGDAQIHNKAFFVPYRTVFPAWNDFITDLPHIYPLNETGPVSSVPLVNLYTFSQLFLYVPSSGAQSNDLVIDRINVNDYDGDDGAFSGYDLVFFDGNSTYTALQLSRKGRRFLRLLLSLGYSLETNNAVATTISVSIMPLLCCAKLYMDWYYPQAYVQDERAQFVNSLFVLDVPVGNFDYDRQVVYDILDCIDVVNYDNDIYTGAWDNPANSTDGSYTPISFKDPTTVETSTAFETNQIGTPIIVDGTDVTSYSLTALRAASDYAKRNQLAGARNLDRYLARYGVSLDSAKLNRSLFIHEYNDIIQFGDVTATASTDGAILGDFAGKGIGYSKSSFNFSTDEFGMLFIITTIVPRIGYYQGMHRENMHISRFDFLTGEFDALGVQAVSRAELYMPLMANEKGDVDVNAVEFPFGYIPRYGHYKVGYDQITGDYRCASINKGRDAWTLFRDVSQFFRNGDGVHDINFVRGVDADQYRRIFSYIADGADHFNVHHQFAIKSSFPGKSLYDNYEFENEDEAKKVTLNVNGVKAN